MLPHISDDLSSSFIEKLEGMLQKYRGETVNFDSRKVRKFKEFKFPRLDVDVKEVLHTPAGETVLDMGQNFAGYLTFESNLPEGTRITLDFGEVLQQGNFYNDNYRTAEARFTYVSDGRKETVRPHFTVYGFRYVRVTGWDGEPDPALFRGCAVYSDLETVSSLESSHPGLNRLFLNCLWGQKSNFLDMPTDCPQRDERLGWTGDAQVFSPTACYNMDTRAFYRKFLADLWDGTEETGRLHSELHTQYRRSPGRKQRLGGCGGVYPNDIVPATTGIPVCWLSSTG